MRRWIPWITGILMIGALGWTFFYLKDVHPLGALGTRMERDHLAGVGIRFRDATLVGRADGQKAWEIKAETVDISKDRRLATFSGLSQGVLIQDDKKIATISADTVTYNTFTRNVSAPGTAELKLVDGPSLKVRKVFWNAQKSKLYCEGGAEAAIGVNTMQGDRLTADLERKEITATKVKGSIRIPD